MKFVYNGSTVGGGSRSGKVEALDVSQAKSILGEQGIRVDTITQSRSIFDANIRLGGSRVKLKDVAWFARTFATTQKAHLPLTNSLTMLARMRQGSSIGDVIDDIRRQVNEGKKLTEAFRAHESQLGAQLVAFIQEGETSGQLDSALTKGAALLERQVRLRRQIKSAGTYPAVVGGISALLFVSMLVFIVPVFRRMFASYGIPLPFMTQMVIGLSDAMTKACWYPIGPINLPLLPMFFVGLFFGFRKLVEDPRMRLTVDSLKLKIPVIGTVIDKGTISRISSTLASASSSGLAIQKAWALAAKTADNALYEERIHRIQNLLSGEGSSVAAAMRAHDGDWPELMTEMVAVAEAGGDLVALLDTYSATVEEEVQAAVEALKSLIEPMMIVVVGSIVGTLIISLYMPLFSITQNMPSS